MPDNNQPANVQEPVQGKVIAADDSSGPLVAGVVTGATTAVGFGSYVWNKLWNFDKDLAKRVRTDITKSTGAGLDSLGGGSGGGLMGHGAIRDFHERALIEETGSKLAKVRNFSAVRYCSALRWVRP